MFKSFQINGKVLAGFAVFFLIFTFLQQYSPIQMKSILSGSMEPVFYTGSIILEKKTDQHTVFRQGDVITFKVENGIHITHRIQKAVKKNGETFYVTKGDHNNGPDSEMVSSRQIVGKYLGITIPYAGYVHHFLYTKIGLLAFMILPGIFLLVLSWRMLFLQKTSVKQG
ncbi:signal peptidase I [Metabacillus sp. GX 13764]|uniref:signal peptidase I n=1 Tax=Metabacillus kandeliae TaxID=2900151 RepID=UPI001E3AF1EF|nr:signal peptidase I [Metabacillus kandeliae]MCD7033168.1 signal peptidase I [Metabacillus kandeliae]